MESLSLDLVVASVTRAIDGRGDANERSFDSAVPSIDGANPSQFARDVVPHGVTQNAPYGMPSNDSAELIFIYVFCRRRRALSVGRWLAI